MDKLKKEIKKAASILSTSKRATASSGSGISAESGISTFRDPGGIWDQVDPISVGTSSGLMNFLQENSDKLIPLLFDILDSFEKADPNPGHMALFDLEKMGILKTVITQNVDNLHLEAGTTDLIEVHGNLFQMLCLSCGSEKRVNRKSFIRDIREKLSSFTSYDLANLIKLAPICDQCASIMRPDVVMFGEAVKDLTRAFQVCHETDAMLILGTSGVVYPAAAFPGEAKNAGAKIIEINPNESAFSGISDVYIPMKTGEALPAIVQEINKILDQ